MPAGSTTALRGPQSKVQGGFTYVAVLAALLLVSLGTQGVMFVASQQAQREREDVLLNIGTTYARAIGSYYRATPGSVKRWPASLEELLEDKRLLQVHRHIRELYPDPMTRSMDWELVPAPEGGIQGIRSRSSKAPLRTGPVAMDEFLLPAATRYADWTFIYRPEMAPPTSAAAKVQP
ncbi:type II secretion system protein [uncultured Rhodoferax sp.]|uniref:type II secretion system protein n=1 Tax=uncultured Rhodoferax sp. TaxID=223188 RepID=UPI0025E5369E|nr:type II secretion system protein [uncultured Rhodoferax sp.]